MKKIGYTLGLLFSLITFVACDNTTDDIGQTIIGGADIAIKTDTFSVSTRSVLAGSVLSRNITAYLGKVRDPETGSYVTGDCMIQFNCLEGFSFPKKDSIRSLENGEIIADSCEIRLFPSGYYGDSITPMKMRVYEMDKPMNEGKNYYSDYNPHNEGLIASNAYSVSRPYTIYDQSEVDSIRNNKYYQTNIRVLLNDKYTDRNGNQYKNYGTYILRKYFANPADFKNDYTFIHNVVPGFFFENTGGLGSMAYIGSSSQLNLYFQYVYNDSVMKGVVSFAGTEEVLQTSTITNSQNIAQLANDNSCTYLKSPAGIFTEMTLPIDQIFAGHDKEYISSAKITLKRINNTTTSKYALGAPTTLLIIPKSEMRSFFENNKIVDYKSTFLATYTSSTNSYTFNNISGLINHLNQNRNNADWNKVVLIPVSIAYRTDATTGGQTIASVVHDMSLTSTRLVKGTDGADSPVKISIIYSKFK